MVKSITAVFIFTCCNIVYSQDMCLESDYDRILLDYDKAHGTLGRGNLDAFLVWQRSFYIEGLLEAYLCTKKEKYIRSFISHVTDIMSLRDDVVKRVDYTGRSRPGYSVSGHYPISMPVTFFDESGNPSLKISAIRFTANNFTSVDVIRSKKNKYKIIATNNHKGDISKEIYDNLDQLNVESKVNIYTGKDKLIKVEAVGEGMPRDLTYRYENLPKIIMHSHHDGSIYSPIIRFLSLINDGQIPEVYRKHQNKWVKFVEQALLDNEENWIDNGLSGYYRTPKGIPFWCDGAPEVINAMSEMGRLYLYLWKVTRKDRYLQRVEKIIMLVTSIMVKNNKGKLTWTYWHGVALRGWEPSDNISMNSPQFEGYPREDNTHYAQYTIRFLVEAHLNKINGVTDDHIRDLIGVFDSVWKGGSFVSSISNKYISVNLQGNLDRNFGRDDIDAYGFAYLGCYDKTIAHKLYGMYKKKFLSLADILHRPGAALYTWALFPRIIKNCLAELP